MIDLDRVHPVSDGHWHRVAHPQRLPQPGDRITMLCGRVEQAEYVSTAEQTVAIQTCWVCDLAYRRQQGIQVLPTHPGLTALGQSTPSPRRGEPGVKKPRLMPAPEL
jgi:hypothetical protein